MSTHFTVPCSLLLNIVVIIGIFGGLALSATSIPVIFLVLSILLITNSLALITILK